MGAGTVVVRRRIAMRHRARCGVIGSTKRTTPRAWRHDFSRDIEIEVRLVRRGFSAG
jgi:hypothetical protein